MMLESLFQNLSHPFAKLFASGQKQSHAGGEELSKDWGKT
jgi:hypothetical protein